MLELLSFTRFKTCQEPVQLNSLTFDFLGGGLWSPDKDQLAAMRREIDRHPRRFRDILNNKLVAKEFLEKTPKAGKDLVSAFVQKNAKRQLVTTPKVCMIVSVPFNFVFAPNFLDITNITSRLKCLLRALLSNLRTRDVATITAAGKPRC